MARKVQVVLEDDIDGGEAAETISFALDGKTYDLTHVVATPGQRPGDPAMWAVWKVRP